MALGLAPLLLTLAGTALANNATKTYGNSDVKWSACGELANKTLECATIHVPMDQFGKVQSNKTFSIPLKRMMSNISDAQTILLNPGGPGAGGIEFLKGFGPSLDKILGGKYHLLGFDPRSVDGSSPQATCAPDGYDVGSGDKNPLGPLIPSWDWTLSLSLNSGDFYAGYSNYAQLCMETLGEHIKYINTPQTAADMNSILDSIGQSQLNYYGTSYGTLLSTTYAQLYPEKVGRVAIDGVVDYESYYAGSDRGFTVDLDACWTGLLSHCLAERATCPLADGFTNVTKLDLAIRQKLDALDIDPVSVYINSTAYGILRGADIRGYGVFPRLYSPSRWPYLVRSLAYLLQNNYTVPYVHFFGSFVPENPRHKSVLRADSFGVSEDAQSIITLSDSSPEDQLTKTRLTRKEVLDAYKPYPGYMGRDVALGQDFQAATWLLPRTHNLKPARVIKTARPVLILSNKLDPVTPLVGAQALEKILVDSVVLVQDSIGHTTTSKPSRCTAGHVNAYFNGGTMPPRGTVCQVDDPYFPDPDLMVSKISASNAHFELDQALKKMAEFPEQLAARRTKHF